MQNQTAKSIINLMNDFQCQVIRQAFLKLQEDENSTNQQLVDDANKWDKYLDSYCMIFREMNKDIPVQ